jgi:DNA-binding transcriptional regulator YhcF (GntR family)
VKLYERLAKDIEGQVRRGVFRHGDRIASVRQTSLHHKLSITTVIHAYLLLESKGIIESRPQSGYFVRLAPDGAGSKITNELLTSKPIAVSAQVDVSRLVLSTLRSIGTESAVPLGSPFEGACTALRVVHEEPHVRVSDRLGDPGPLPRSSRKAQVPQHADDAVNPAARDRRIPGA